MTEKELTTIEFTTVNGGVKPIVRSIVKKQFIKKIGLGDDFTEIGNGVYRMPIAIDYLTKEVIYGTVECKVGFETKPKEKKKKTTEKVDVPNLF